MIRIPNQSTQTTCSRTPNLYLLVTAVVVLIVAAAPVAAQTTWHVDDDAPADPGPGDPTVSDPAEDGSPDHPFDAIQEAINAATDGDTVLVADGTYTGVDNKNLDFAGKAITIHSENGADNCIIDCEGYGRGFYFHSGEGETSVVEGLTVANGSASRGGGACCDGSSPTFTSCVFLDGRASYDGGGVYCSYSSAKMINCAFLGNLADNGGGMHNRASSPTVTNCAFVRNSANNGGGMHNRASSPTVANCMFLDNSAPIWRGGGVCNWDSSLTVTNCTFTGNSTNDGGGGGIANDSDSNTTMANSILWGNTPNELSGPALVTYSDVQGGWPGDGNIDVDPGFAFDADPHLAAGSPCIDAGTNDPSGGLPTDDLDGNPRPLDGNSDTVVVADMGAYEFNADAPSIAFSPQLVELFVPEGEPNAVTLPLFIRNCGGGELIWQIVAQCSWVEVDPSGGVSGGEVNELSVIVDASDLPHGRHTCELTISDSAAVNDSRTVPVALHVNTTLSVPAEYHGIQAAIDATVPGDVVLIANGIYRGPANRDLDFHGKAITVRSEYGPQNCTIDCQGSGRGFYFHSRESAQSVVDGLTITNGNTYFGSGGIYCSPGSPTVRNCVFSGNAGSSGGGMSNGAGSNPTVTSCAFIDNRGEFFAGGMDNYHASPTVTDCIFSGNWAYQVGGGMANTGGSPTVTNCTFTGNWAAYDGGGMWTVGGNLIVMNCVFSGNSCGDDGGGIYNSEGSPAVTNCTFSGNSADEGGGMYNRGGSTPTVANCILWADAPDEICDEDPNSTTSVTYSDIQGGWDGEGNIDADPLFVDPNNGDYHPGFRSQCVDAGDSTAVPADSADLDGDGDVDEPTPFDLDGNPRFVDDPATPDTGNGTPPIVDMGAYEFQVILAWLDIKPGSCPNPLNRNSHGVVPMAVVGTADFDVTQIDLESLVLTRADGVGGAVAPLMGPPGPGIGVEDVATPFEGEPCDCHDLAGDGTDDLSMKFDTEAVVSELELDDLPGGAWVELVVSGQLSDGRRFSATDCVRLVPKSPDSDGADGEPGAPPDGQPAIPHGGFSAGDSSRQNAGPDRRARPPASEPDDADADEDESVRDASIAPIVGCGPISPVFFLGTVAATRLLRRW